MGTICSTQEWNKKCARNVDRRTLIWVQWLTLRPSDDLLPTKLPLLPLLLLLFLLLLLLLLLTSLAVIASQIVYLRNRESRWNINYHFTRKFWLLGAVTAYKSRKIFDMPRSCNTAVASPHSDILCCTHERARCRVRWERALVPHCEKQPGRPPPPLAAQGRGNRMRHKRPRKTDVRHETHRPRYETRNTYVKVRLWEADRSRYEETRNRPRVMRRETAGPRHAATKNRPRHAATKNRPRQEAKISCETEKWNEKQNYWDMKMWEHRPRFVVTGADRPKGRSDRKHTEAGNDEKQTEIENDGKQNEKRIGE
jgi:hypothetical protein